LQKGIGKEAGTWIFGIKSKIFKWILTESLQDGRRPKLYWHRESCFWLFAEENALQVYTPEFEGRVTLNMFCPHTIYNIYFFNNAKHPFSSTFLFPSCGKLKILSAGMTVTKFVSTIVVM